MKIFDLFSGRLRYILVTGFYISLVLQGCVRDKYDFSKLSTQAHLSQEWVVPVVHGTMKMENMVKPNDTIVFDDDGAVRLVYRNDSIFTQDVSDLVDLEDQDPDSVTFGLGPFKISDATVTADIPNVTGNYDLDTLPNMHWVFVRGGRLAVTVQNNLSVQVTSMTLRLKNRADNSVVGHDLTFTNIPSGGSATLEMDLAGERVTQELVLQIVSLSPSVALQNDAFTLTVHTYDIEANRGEAILPEQFLYGDTGIYRIEEDTLQITRLDLSRGFFDINVRTNFPEEVDLEIVFPEARQNGDTLRYSYVIPGNTLTDSLVLDGVSFDLSTDTTQPYNAVPYRYLVTMKNSGGYVDFSGIDVFHLRYRLRHLTLDYAEGYFGEQEFSVDRDTIDTGLEDLFSRIHGTFSLTDPKVRILYKNGFGIPVEISADVTGIAMDGREQALNASPMTMDRPADRDAPPAEGALEFNRDNSDIVAMIDLRPVKIVYGGSARVNPGGFTAWDNFVSAQSSLVAGLEVEVPLEFRMQDLQLEDTLDNPFHTDDRDTSEYFLQDLDHLDLYLGADNGFPIALSVKMYLYDTLTHVVSDSILFGRILDAAPVDGGGRVTESISTKQTVRIEGAQLDHLEEANALILAVTFNTSDEGAKSVKIYTDYTLAFRLAVATRVDQDFDMSE